MVTVTSGNGRERPVDLTYKVLQFATSWEKGRAEDHDYASVATPLLDPLDTAIVRALEQDARMSLLELSRQVGASRPTVTERLARLRERGVIRGFHALLDYRWLDYPIAAFVGVQVANPSLTAEVVEALKTIPEIEELHTVTGQIDILVKVRARSTEHLQHVLIFKIQAVPSVGRFETMLTLASHLEWAPVGVIREIVNQAPASGQP